MPLLVTLDDTQHVVLLLLPMLLLLCAPCSGNTWSRMLLLSALTAQPLLLRCDAVQSGTFAIVQERLSADVLLLCLRVSGPSVRAPAATNIVAVEGEGGGEVAVL